MLLRSVTVLILCLVLMLGIKTLNNSGKDRVNAIAEPSLPRIQMLDWTAGTITNAFTFNRQTYKQVFERAVPKFTPAAYEQFGNVITQLGVINIMQHTDLTSVASMPNLPMITASGVTDGAYEWAINFDLTLAVLQQGATTPQQVPLRFRVLVRQVGTDDLVTGLVISGLTPMRLDEGERLP